MERASFVVSAFFNEKMEEDFAIVRMLGNRTLSARLRSGKG